MWLLVGFAGQMTGDLLVNKKSVKLLKFDYYALLGVVRIIVKM